MSVFALARILDFGKKLSQKMRGDIIARRGRYLCFVEVKTRSKNAMGEPSRYVTFQKQRKIIKTASAFLCGNNFELMPRFDVAEVSKSGLLFKVHYIKNAFCVNEHNDPTYRSSR